MLKTIEGIYQDGQIQFNELPQDVSDRSQVLITFLDPSKINSAKLRQLIDRLETINVYRVLFAIRDDTVYALSVRHSAQAPLTLNDIEELEGGV